MSEQQVASIEAEGLRKQFGGKAVLRDMALTVAPGAIFEAAFHMVATIVLMIVLDVVHPPALSFAFRAGDERSLVLFALTVGMIAVLVVLEQATLWLLSRRLRRAPKGAHPGPNP